MCTMGVVNLVVLAYVLWGWWLKKVNFWGGEKCTPEKILAMPMAKLWTNVPSRNVLPKNPRLGCRTRWLTQFNQFFVVHRYISRSFFIKTVSLVLLTAKQNVLRSRWLIPQFYSASKRMALRLHARGPLRISGDCGVVLHNPFCMKIACMHLRMRRVNNIFCRICLCVLSVML